MPDDGSNLISMRPANSPNAFDLRRIGAHPDYWYPLAWSARAQDGQGASDAGSRASRSCCIAALSGRVFALEDRCAHRQVPLHLGVVLRR